LERVSELRRRIEDLDRGLNEVKSSRETNKGLVVRMDEIEAALESQRAEESAEDALLVRIDKLEAAIESQRSAIESLEKLCRMYEDQIQSQRESIKD
jgi:predicted  nucleic acid-binding Zn-ribbon protein